MEKKRIPVIAIFDVGKTNKKLFLFNERYQLVFERSARFLETTDEDGDPCENLESLRLSVFDSLHEVFRRDEFDIKAINFASYGASVVYLDEHGRPLTPLYNYLKAYPSALEEQLYAQYDGPAAFALTTASPRLGSLNLGLQLYRLQQERPDLFDKVKYAVHLPQYLSFLVSGQLYTDMTSLGCHTALWDFVHKDYHRWVSDAGMLDKLPPLVSGEQVFSGAFPGATYKVGVGLHDSSSALIPYLLNFKDPFILISTGTWCISLNPFNDTPLTEEELRKDCLFYLTYSGTPVKASRLFAGQEHEIQVKRIADYFEVTTALFRNMRVDWEIVDRLRQQFHFDGATLAAFGERNLGDFSDATAAYHALMMDLVASQVAATQLVMGKQHVGRIFVDGGFSKNDIYMNLLANSFPNIEVYAASMAQATAIGAALVIHAHWNTLDIPHDLIELRYYRHP
ncbi:FGGY-family carbohydrate kinase [Sphingobacterium sp. MYb382]|uniref:FGGY-family carbohydrate kinase n=1 Tax=Sphingobacterium sp. MYb382 TaxID=2745278 RepID=UPI00309F72EB